MATLYEISQDYVHLIEGGFIIDEDTGEVLFDPSNIDDKEAELREKLESVSCFVKNLEAEAAAIKAEEESLAKRRKTKERKADRLRSYMLGCMDSTDLRKLDTPRASLSIRKSSRVEVTDEAALRQCAPMAFKPQPDKLDKTLLRKIMKEGGSVAGARLVDTESLVLK